MARWGVPLPDRLAAGFGILGPTAFVGGWLVSGLRTDGYDPGEQAISQLAREGAPTRVSMTLAFVAFGVLMPFWAPVLARRLHAPALRPAVTTAALATVAVAAFPLSREPGGAQDALHTISAATGYVAMALTPLIAAVALRRHGRSGLAAISAAVGLASALCLVGTTVSSETSGAFQRAGLGVVDLWHVVAAAAVLAGARRSGEMAAPSVRV